jgi:trans-aconitate methyltransferase
MTAPPPTAPLQPGDPYERYMGRWSRPLALRLLAWLAQRHGQRWLDVGCGTGALCTAILDHAAPARVMGIDPSDEMLAAARASLGTRAELHRASAESIPLGDDAVDVTVSSLVLQALPDAPRALLEMTRVTRGGGIVAAAVWDYALRARFIRLFWDAAASADSRAAALDEAARHPLCQPEPLTALFAGAGLQGVRTGSIEIETRFANFDDCWQALLHGQGAAPDYMAGLDEPARQRLRKALRSRMPVGPGGATSLAARAWVVRGTVV